MSVTVSAFYKFVAIDEPLALRDRMLGSPLAREMKGTILLAHEGLNGTISGAPSAIAAFLADLRADPRFTDLTTKDAAAPDHPFKRLKIKVKREIIAFGQADADPHIRVGTYVPPAEWNRLIADPEVLVLDVRNAFEVAAGTFAGAVDPSTRRFSEFAAYVTAKLDPARHRKIAMFCTGGIRCEKASSYLKARGFEDVYQLQGGILAYLAAVPPPASTWQGQCFVFDERESVDGRQTRPPP